MYLQLQGLMQHEHYDRRKQEPDGILRSRLFSFDTHLKFTL